MKRIHEKEFVSYLHPCNEFTIGYVPKKKVTKKEAQYNRDEKRQWERHEIQLISWWGRIENIRINWLVYDKILDQKRFTPLGLSNAVNCHTPKKRAKRGSNGMTGKMGRMLKDGAAILERRWGAQRLGFYTFTLPSLDRDFLIHFITESGGWSRLVRTFMQSLKRLLIKRGGDGNIVGCSEIQEKRYLRRGEVAPHLHLTFKCFHDKYKWYISANELRELWRRSIQNHLNRLEIGFVEIDVKASVDCSVVKKSVVSYLGKYISKGGNIIKEIAKKEGVKVLCSCWGHISDKLRKFVKTQIKSLSDGEMKAILYDEVDLVARGYLCYLFPVKIILGDKEFVCGYSGKKNIDLYQLNYEEYNSFKRG